MDTWGQQFFDDRPPKHSGDRLHQIVDISSTQGFSGLGDSPIAVENGGFQIPGPRNVIADGDEFLGAEFLGEKAAADMDK